MLLALAACKKEGGSSESGPNPEAQYILEGTVNTPGFTWETNSSVGLYSATAGVKIVNKECLIEGWADTNAKDEEGNPLPYTPSPYEGKATGRFTTPPVSLASGKNDFVAYTPYNPELVYLNNIIYALEVGQNQVQPTPDVASSCFSFGEFSGTPGEEAFHFSLDPVTALVKIAVSSTEFAGMNVTKVELVDLGGRAEIGGAFNVNTKTRKFQKLETFSKVMVSVTNPAPLEVGQPQNFYLQALPGDYSTNNMWAVVYFESQTKTVTIPVSLSGVVLEAGQTKEINLANITMDTNQLRWYCPVETRKLPGLGYCYGEANTYLIQCKNGSTWKGATYSANADIPDEVTIDFRARGNFSNAVNPTGATFEWYTNGSETYIPVVSGSTTTYDDGGINPKAFTITEDPDNYQVKVKNWGAYAGAPILVMKKGGRILWAWSFWNISADGTKLEAISAGPGSLANMDIGQNTTQFEQWSANKWSSPSQSPSEGPDVIYRFVHRYQWGRFTPVFWSFWPTVEWYSTPAAVPVVEGPLYLNEAISKPVGLVLKREKGTENRMTDWANENDRYGDLWGGGLKASTREEEGNKTIYDPCPKGWRVPDPLVFDYIAQQNATINSTYDGAVICKMANAGNNSFIMNGYYEDYIADTNPPRIATMGAPKSGKQTSMGILWSNWVGWHQGVQPLLLSYGTDIEPNRVTTSTRNRAIAASVRCQKDERNR